MTVNDSPAAHSGEAQTYPLRTVEVLGDPLRCLEDIGDSVAEPSRRSRLHVVGLDARRILTKAGFAALVHRRGRTVLECSGSASQVVVVIEHVGLSETWMHSAVHRWALSIHRRIERARGTDTTVTVLVVDGRTSPQLIAWRLEELAHRPPGLNPAAVLFTREICAQTIAEAATNDFI